MAEIRNTTEDMRDPVEMTMFLLNQMGSPDPGDPGPAIMHMEAEGQRQLVNSDRLPTRVLHAKGGDQAFIDLGFTFGPPDPRDKLFRPATLPEGWRREGSDHSMWSYLVDDLGRQRVAIFYKAAFYDRDAHMWLETRYDYLHRALYDKRKPVLDAVWLTPTLAAEELAKMAEASEVEASKCLELAESRPDDDYWPKRAEEHRAEREAALALRNRILAVSET